MIVDSSAIVAILFSEPEADRCLATLRAAPSRTISAGNLLETHTVIDRSGLSETARLVEDLLAEFGIDVAPVTREQVAVGRRAYSQFGKGSGHGKGLNYGDCFAYALTRQTGEPLLFVGNDFGKTDIGIA